MAPKGGVLFDGTSRLSRKGEHVHHYLGVSSFAEEVVVPASGAVKVRDDAPLDVIAVVGVRGGDRSGCGAEHRRGGAGGATVAVIGCGGVGLNVVQGAKLAGAERIVAIDVKSDKTQLAMQFGATDRVDASRGGDAVEQLLALVPDGVDYAFDAFGNTSTTEQAIRMLGLGGAAVIVGLPPTGARASFEPLVLAEADQRILVELRIGAAVDRHPGIGRPIHGRSAQTGPPLVWARRPLAEAAEAFDDLESGEALRTLLIP